MEDVQQDRPVLHVDLGDHTVPVAALGAGLHGVLRLAIDLSALPAGIALVEEPEAHQHPAAVRQTAIALLSAARRGVQVIVSTHSLELIDSVLDEAGEADLNSMAIYRVVLDRGTLRSSRFSGAMCITARRSMDEDVR